MLQLRSQSGPVSDGHKEVLCIPPNSSIAVGSLVKGSLTPLQRCSRWILPLQLTGPPDFSIAFSMSQRIYVIRYEELYFMKFSFNCTFKFLAQFLLDHLPHAVIYKRILLLHKFAAFTNYVINRFVLVTT